MTKLLGKHLAIANSVHRFSLQQTIPHMYFKWYYLSKSTPFYGWIIVSFFRKKERIYKTQVLPNTIFALWLCNGEDNGQLEWTGHTEHTTVSWGQIMLGHPVPKQAKTSYEARTNRPRNQWPMNFFSYISNKFLKHCGGLASWIFQDLDLLSLLLLHL